jgi:hypothetical protein
MNCEPTFLDKVARCDYSYAFTIIVVGLYAGSVKGIPIRNGRPPWHGGPWGPCPLQ